MMTATEMRAYLVELLAGAAGGDPARWDRCVGRVAWHPLGANPHPNWSIAPTGTRKEIDAIRQAEALVRDHHRFVIGD
jgi:hypothetical protein